MSIGKRIIRWVDSMVNLIMVILFLMLAAYGIYAIWDSEQIYQGADPVQYDKYKPTKEDALSFEELRGINPEVFGWLTVYGTNIDYPLVQAEDNETYVNTTVTGEYRLSGSIFLDCRNSNYFSDFNSIIFGHHMEKRAMFGEIGEFLEETYFDSHPYGRLYYEGEERGIEFFAFLEADAYDQKVYLPGVSGDEEKSVYLQNLLSTARYTREIPVSTSDHIVLLSTCSSGSTNGRHILAGKITDETFGDLYEEQELEQKESYRVASQELWENLRQAPLWVLATAVTVLASLLLLWHKIRKRKKRRKGDGTDEQEQRNA
ncbi:MAG TPA: class B sortase [Candidatus Pelethocola excrementipullorum]|nr:class B sortase [Candidatus Pelethocola excrementipullorum]